MPMSSSSGSTTAQQLIERSDVHKSCKAIETLVNLFNDYCEATNALCGIQKKFYKALKETAGVKGNAEVCTSAFGSAAAIFESIVEVDTKFSKIIDKECETVSAEIRKWFKKLAKEEKSHDERLASANEKINKAGQAYEKAAKRKSSAALEEHNRYMNVISTLGPEVSQDKYNHTLLVTQRHTRLLLSVAASMGRLSESEWIRQCERVRRCASLIGEVGQWRAYCEGEWASRAPPDLEDGNPLPHSDPFLALGPRSSRETSGETNLASSDGYPQSQASGPSRATTPATPQYRTRKVSPLPSPSSQQPTLTTVPSSQSISQASSVEDSKSLADFDPSTVKSFDGPGFNTLTSAFPIPPSTLPGAPTTPERGSRIRKSSLVAMNIPPSMIPPGNKSVSPTEEQERSVSSERTDTPTGGTGSAGKGSRVAAMRDKYDKGPVTPSSPTSPAPREEVEESQKKGMVHFRRTSANVADLASRYDPSGGRRPLSPTPQSEFRQTFPAKNTDLIADQILSSSVSSSEGILTAEPRSMNEREGESGPNASEGDNDQTIRAVDRSRRMQELRHMALEEQERTLQEQRRRLEAEARGLQLEKKRLASIRSGGFDGGDTEDLPKPEPPYRRPSYSQSYTHLPSASIASSSAHAFPVPNAAPSTPSRQPQKLLSSRKPRTSLTSISSISLVPPVSATNHLQPPSPMTPGHPMDCNCVSCVLNRPADAPNPAHLRAPKSEKPKGFFRRLSMEVGNTFSLSEGGRKRSNSNLNLQAAMHASTIAGHGPTTSTSGSGFYGPGSGISNVSMAGGKGRQYTRAEPAANELGVLPRQEYFPSRR